MPEPAADQPGGAEKRYGSEGEDGHRLGKRKYGPLWQRPPVHQTRRIHHEHSGCNNAQAGPGPEEYPRVHGPEIVNNAQYENRFDQDQQAAQQRKPGEEEEEGSRHAQVFDSHGQEEQGDLQPHPVTDQAPFPKGHVGVESRKDSYSEVGVCDRIQTVLPP